MVKPATEWSIMLHVLCGVACKTIAGSTLDPHPSTRKKILRDNFPFGTLLGHVRKRVYALFLVQVVV